MVNYFLTAVGGFIAIYAICLVVAFLKAKGKGSFGQFRQIK